MNMISPFDNDPFAILCKAFQNLYPEKDFSRIKIVWQPEDIRDENGTGYVGVTHFADDGDITVDISCMIPVDAAVETLAHELAHIAVGPKEDHGEAWENAFDAIHAEYDRVGVEVFGEQRVNTDADGKTKYEMTVKEYEDKFTDMAAQACTELSPDDYCLLMKNLTLVFRDPNDEEADGFPVEEDEPG